MRKNSEKYEGIVKSRKDELKRKRGALELNSDLDMDLQERQSELPPGISRSSDVTSYKSKLHNQIRQQDRDAKDRQFKNFMEKQDKNDRIKNYSKNVKDLYMPGRGKRPTISQGRLGGLSDSEAINNGVSAQERKAYLATDAD